eukprot:4591046-Lingulodinium_polyedra.AAC.1
MERVDCVGRQSPRTKRFKGTRRISGLWARRSRVSFTSCVLRAVSVAILSVCAPWKLAPGH